MVLKIKLTPVTIFFYTNYSQFKFLGFSIKVWVLCAMNKKVLLIIAIGIALLIAGLCGFLFWKRSVPKLAGVIKVGVLHSQTGAMAESEQGVINATLLAIEEVNAEGGVLGKRLAPVVIDGKSNGTVFAECAEKLITEEKVPVIFGCWTSASRKSVKPVVEKHKSLLMYPLQYEGLEQSPNIIYTGATPNQQIIPAIIWATRSLGKKFFLVGSDYVFPQSAHAIMKDCIAAQEGTVVGEAFLLLDAQDASSVVQEIVKTKPDVILNCINGTTNKVFFKQLRAAGITPEKIPTISFSIAEPELTSLDSLDFVGDYAVWSYVQTIDRQENFDVIEKYKKRFGTKCVFSDPMEAAYNNVHFWAKAVAAGKSTDVKTVIASLKQQIVNGPGSIVYLDQNNHAWRHVFIAKIMFDRQFSIVWASKKAVPPCPFPPYRTVAMWEDFLNKLFEGWGKKWQK